MSPTPRIVKLLFLLAFSTTASLLIAAPGEQAEAPSILVIDSYHNGFAWADEELHGVLARLEQAYPRIDVRVEYMDAKRFPGPDHAAFFKDYLKHKYRDHPVDLLIALDNPALEMLLRYHGELLPSVPVVFAGISDLGSLRFPPGMRLTGVAETIDLVDTLRVAFSLSPGRRHVLLVSDGTTSGIAVRREAEKAVERFVGKASFEFLPPSTWEEAVTRISSLRKDSLLVLLSFSTDRTGRSLSSAESTRLLTSRSPVPAYAMHEGRLGYGVVGGVMLSGVEHGRRAGDLAARVLAGEDPSAIPIDMSSTSVPSFDYNQLVRYRIPLILLPKDSRIINRPMTVFDQFPMFSWVMIGLVVSLIACACLLAARMFRQRDAERDLRASRANINALIETTGDWFCSCDREGRLIAYNSAFARTVLDYSGIIVRPGMRYHEHLPPDARDALDLLTVRSLGGERVSDVHSADIKGTRRFFEVSVYPILAGREVIGTVEFARDVTEKKRSEQALRETEENLLQARKMEAVGRLAGGITHDFNNLLTVIRAHADMAIDSQGEGRTSLEDLRQIQKTVGRAAALTSQLLAFSRKQARIPRVMSLNELIAEMTKMLGRLIGENIELAPRLQDGLWNIRADGAQIQQIIMNVVLNARDAMPTGGRLSITTENVPRDPLLQSADSVALTIADTGRGMDEETLSHIFEPFFTTKEEGKGTGLGLSTVYGFVKQSGGEIACVSRPGEGTTFRIRFPRADANAEAGDETPHEKRARSESATVMIVEDEEAVRAFLTKTLSAAGYVIMEAGNGQVALDILRASPTPFDLVVTDVMMPRMGGVELARRAREQFPTLKILFISGYAGDDLLPAGEAQDSSCILRKPFGPGELLEAVRATLRGPAASRLCP